MAAHCPVETPGGEPVIGAGAKKIETCVPLADFVARAEDVAPKATHHPGGLQVDADELNTTTFKLSTKKKGYIRPQVYIARVTV